MPEIVTKYPQVVLKILKDAHCNMATQPKILTHCPKENFCSFSTGEFCVYDVKDISQMKQIHFFDIVSEPHFIWPAIPLLIIIFLIGLMVGIKLNKPFKPGKK